MQELDVLMDNQKLKPHIVQSLVSVLAGQALLQLVEEKVSNFYLQALQLYTPVVSDEWDHKSSRRSVVAGSPILCKDSLYLANENQIHQVMTFVCENGRSIGMHTPNLMCPIELAKLRLLNAEDKLIEQVECFTEIKPEDIGKYGRSEVLELLLDLLVSAAESQGYNLNSFRAVESALFLGERIETIVLARESGIFGQYLDSDAFYFGIVKIDDVQYGVLRCIEVDSPWYWKVINLQNNLEIEVQDKHELGCLKFL